MKPLALIILAAAVPASLATLHSDGALPGPADASPATRSAARASQAPVTGAAARSAFRRLTALAGEWEGISSDAATGAVHNRNALFDYRLTGAGSALMELANAGTPDEMLSLFFMEGDRLILQHYCTVANQPRLELVRADSTSLVFDLTGGTNLDPGSDGHIHRVRFSFRTDGVVESFWSWFERGREDHVNRRVLRARAAAR